MSFDKNEVLTLVKEGNVDKLVTYEIFYGRVLRMMRSIESFLFSEAALNLTMNLCAFFISAPVCWPIRPERGRVDSWS